MTSGTGGPLRVVCPVVERAAVGAGAEVGAAGAEVGAAGVGVPHAVSGKLPASATPVRAQIQLRRTGRTDASGVSLPGERMRTGVPPEEIARIVRALV